MKTAPMPLKIVLMLLMCAVCSTAVVGLITRDVWAFKIAGTCAVLCVVFMLGWKMTKKSGDV